jgi:hypothetical protein
MRKCSFVLTAVLFFVAGLFFTNSVLVGGDDTKQIGSPANPSVQTGWWFNIASKVGIEHVDKADMAQIATQNIAKMKVVNPAILQQKGFPNIQAGAMVQVKRVSDKQAKVKLLPDGPEKAVNF